jgi:hypothetical protein
LYGKVKDNHQSGTGFLIDEGNTTVVKKTDFVINIMNYVEMRCRFPDTVLKATETEHIRSAGDVKFIGRNRELYKKGSFVGVVV